LQIRIFVCGDSQKIGVAKARYKKSRTSTPNHFQTLNKFHSKPTQNMNNGPFTQQLIKNMGSSERSVKKKQGCSMFPHPLCQSP